MTTGNNVRVGGDLQRRCYRIGLDPKSPTPWLNRTFRHPELVNWLTAERGRVLAALLTLVRSWYAAGSPASNVQVLGSFEAWSRTIGGILEYVEISGFLGTLQTTYETSDEETAQWVEFLTALHCRQTGAATANAITERLRDDQELAAALPSELMEHLPDPRRAASPGSWDGH